MPAPAIFMNLVICGFFTRSHVDFARMEPFSKKGLSITCKPCVGGFQISLNGSIFPQTVVKVKHASNHDHRETLETVTPNDPTKYDC